MCQPFKKIDYSTVPLHIPFGFDAFIGPPIGAFPVYMMVGEITNLHDTGWLPVSSDRNTSLRDDQIGAKWNLQPLELQDTRHNTCRSVERNKYKIHLQGAF